jgi:tetratricopeptide (TPR) repeat protein
MVNWNIRIELVREQKELDELQHIIHQSHFKTEANALTREAKINFHFIKGLYYYLSGNFKLSLKHFERESELIEAHDAFRSSYLSSYFRSVSNTCFAAIKCKNEKLAQQKIAQLSIFGKGVPGPYRVLVVHLLQLKLYCETKQYREAMVYLKRFEQEIIALVSREEFAEKYYIERAHVLFKAAEIYMMNGETKKPLQMMNIFLDSKNTTVKSDFYCMARIINLLIHFDIDNIDLLEYEIKSIHRFLSGRKRVFLFEQSVLKLVQQLIHPDKHKQRQTYFKAWHKELLKLEQTEFEKNVFDFFDFTYWVERKIEKSNVQSP